MIDLWFQLGGEIILVKIEGNKVSFGSTTYGARLAPIEGLKLSKAGVEKEFPDLKDDQNWREEAIARFKSHIRSLKNEESRAKYIIDDLKKHGYLAKRMQIGGRRIMKLDGQFP